MKSNIRMGKRKESNSRMNISIDIEAVVAIKMDALSTHRYNKNRWIHFGCENNKLLWKHLDDSSH